MQPGDFHLKSNTGHGLDWPFSYGDLEADYCRAEHFLGVAGDSSLVERPPRSAPFPLPAATVSEADQVFGDAADALGLEAISLPVARHTRPINGMPACQTYGACQYCPIGGRFTGDQAVDRLEAEPRFAVRLGAAARRIRMGSKRRVEGVEYVNVATGDTEFVEADMVVICAGTIESPKLLLASTSADWPNGLANASGHVGRNLTSDVMLWVRGTKDTNPQHIQRSVPFPTLCTRHLDTPAEQGRGKFFYTPHPGEVNLTRAMLQSPNFAAVMTAVNGAHTYGLSGFMEAFDQPQNHVALGEGTNAFGAPKTELVFDISSDFEERANRHLDSMARTLEYMGCGRLERYIAPRFGHHAIATCRMSECAAQGVVDANLRVHGTDNVYVCSNAVTPSVGAVNPTVTLVALAFRMARAVPGLPD